MPAENLPYEFQLPHKFFCNAVPKAELGNHDDFNYLYRPYSKRSFLRQYIDWLKKNDHHLHCDFTSHVTLETKFDFERQEYTNDIQYTISDTCSNSSCQFLTSKAVKPLDTYCPTIEILCNIKSEYGLCQTADEAMILKQYLTITGDVHFPMLIPQPSILSGKKRPDFICFVPASKFQYHKVAILIDRPGKDPKSIQDEDKLYKEEGFVVRRIEISKPGKSYFKWARDLVLYVNEL